MQLTMSILSQPLFAYRLLQNIEQSSLGCTAGPCIRFICSSVYLLILVYPSLPRFLFGKHRFVFWVCGSISILRVSSFTSYFRFCMSDVACACLSVSGFAQYGTLGLHPRCCTWPCFTCSLAEQRSVVYPCHGFIRPLLTDP